MPAANVEHPLPAAEAKSLDRARGCLLGQVAGDSLGALVEFMTSDQIATAYPGGLHLLAEGGPWSIVAGQCTDDSEMALALARSLVEVGAFDDHEVMAAYRDWYASGPFDFGQTTAAALSGNEGAIETLRASSQANGSLMRISPIGVFAAGDPAGAARLAASDSALTHPHQDPCRRRSGALGNGAQGWYTRFRTSAK